MITLGIMNHASHDSGAAVVVSDETGIKNIISISEERLSRVKVNYFSPLRSIDYCLSNLGLTLDDVDVISTDYMNAKRFDNSTPVYRKLEHDYIKLISTIDREKVNIYRHHEAHAASAYYMSGFSEAAVLNVDGLGSEYETISLYKGKGNKLELIDRSELWGLGNLYTAITRQLLNFGRGQEGKTMGLAAFGRNSNKRILNFESSYDGLNLDYSNFMTRSPNGKINPIDILPCPDRSLVTSDLYAQIAYDVQEETEKALMHLLEYAKEKAGTDNVCLAGGVILNCLANYIMLESKVFKNYFFQPASSDTGIPLGLALLPHFEKNENCKPVTMKNAYLSATYSKDQISNVLAENNIPHKKSDNAEVAQLLADNKIVGYFYGSSEIGPRALGHRSILANPGNPEVQDLINRKVKHREPYRPFAPSVLAENAADYFELNNESPFMLLAPWAKDKSKEIIPGVVHFDNTSRVQTVSKDTCTNYYDLISKFSKISGIPVLLNTSFNDNGEPIIETPLDALICFMRTDVDFLYLEGHLVSREQINQNFNVPILIETLVSQRKHLLEKEYGNLISKYCPAYNTNVMTSYLKSQETASNYKSKHQALDNLVELLIEADPASTVIFSTLQTQNIVQKLFPLKNFTYEIGNDVLSEQESFKEKLAQIEEGNSVIQLLYNLSESLKEVETSVQTTHIYEIYSQPIADLFPDIDSRIQLNLSKSVEYNRSENWDLLFNNSK
ncbi:carbamoyltransferase family protein [Maridesulfovibrio frigidus]|uniref:carbamoyltransferase family protein n=1 Tax=Maridesulfovibrio frigidus TaxID=340956 RepID=UPI00068F87DF|nr:carbamoyltransferase C-terminal domain-containing protein [Maridesulfovibrio frigidus]